MAYPNLTELKNKISKQHEGDETQLKVIFSDSPHLMVEAPAGFGKTTTMISRIAYLIASGAIPNPKRILGLTFSVNAALKVKREVSEKLPVLIGGKNNPVAVGEKVTVTNYHGFCKGILKRYGYLFTDDLQKDVNLLQAIDENDISKRQELKTSLSAKEAQCLEGMKDSINSANLPDFQSIIEYNKIIIRKLLPLDYITHNAVI
nr:UvrD-helicase domain-containing protein [Saccharofermentans sp.]